MAGMVQRKNGGLGKPDFDGGGVAGLVHPDVEVHEAPSVARGGGIAWIFAYFADKNRVKPSDSSGAPVLAPAR